MQRKNLLSNLFEGLSVRKTLIYIFALIVVTTITYSNHFENSFHFDDSHTIQNNLFIQNINNIPLFFKDATTFSSLPTNQSYRPIVSTSLALDYRWGNGYDLFYFHLSSFIIFILQGILMFFLIFKLFDNAYKTSLNFYFAFAASLWYMVHPANAETINYIIARSDLQSTFFVILSFVLYIFSPFAKRTYLYLLPVAIGALAKPTAVMFAPILLFYVFLFEQDLSLMDIFKKEKVRSVLFTIKTVIPAFVICGLMYLLVDHLTPKTWQSGGVSTFNYLITQPFVILHYFTTFFFPFGLSADTDWEVLTTIWNIKFIIGAAFILFMILIAFIFSRDKRLRPITFGIIWFFLALLPTSSVIPFAEVLNDHRIFFPYVGLVISVVWVIGLFILKYKKHFEDQLRQYYSILIITSFLLVFSYAYGAHERNNVWKTEETLWKDVTIKSPKNARGLMNYGLSQMAKGDYPKAERYFMQALQMWPHYNFLHINLGVLKNALGDKEAAENYFKNAIQYGTNYPDSWYFYGKFLCEHSRFAEAIPMLIKSIELSPAHIGAHEQLMKAYYATNQFDKLNELAVQTLKIIPGNVNAINYLELSRKGKASVVSEDLTKVPTNKKEQNVVMNNKLTAENYLNLSLEYYQKGQYEESIKACKNAILLKPDYADAYSNICASYNQLKEWDKAIEACNMALKINSKHKLANGNLNWAKREKAKTK